MQVPPETLSSLLSSLLGNAAAWEARDADTLQSLSHLVESGLTRWLPHRETLSYCGWQQQQHA